MTARASEGPATSANEIWTATLQELANKLRREQLQTWFLRVAPVSFDGQSFVLAVPSEFHRNWILESYNAAILNSLKGVLGYTVGLQLIIDPERAALSNISVPEQTVVIPAAPRNHAPAARELPPVVAPPQLSLNPNYTFENFVVGPCNRFAFAGAMGVAENPSKAYNPLFLHGSVGLGKTHLLQGICGELLKRRPKTRILYLSCETFTNHFIGALEKGALEEFRRRYRSTDVLVVDDIHFLANKERTQEEFFHTFNAVFQEDKQIVLSSDSPAQEIPTLQDRLISRFKWGLEAEIEKPCLETRLAILQRKARTMNVQISDEIARFLAERITHNIRELEGAINRVVGFAGLERESITLDLVHRAMPELLKEQTTVVRFDDLASIVAKKYHIKIQDLQSRRRHQSIAFPRQVAMYLSRKYTKHSLEEIGAYFGGRDHTTVMYSIDKLEGLLKENNQIRETVDALVDEIGRSFPRNN
ncbi:MAG: chromosomal replication initiator protein DnaA [Planctomycetes bacterium]|nr:chromosomal replication initiator protein DnaA [Planctomycetota bacterium]